MPNDIAAPQTVAGGRIRGAVHEPHRHDSGHKHVSGRAAYIDDLHEPAGLLHLALGLSPVAHGRIRKLDLAPVRAAAGVVLVIAAADIPGKNDISAPRKHDEPVFAVDIVHYAGQPLFAVAAPSRDQARRAVRLAGIEIEPLEPVLTIEQAKRAGELVTEPLTLARGDAAGALARAPRRIAGRMEIGGQEHFYLEGQVAMALPGEDEEVTVLSSTQHPSEIQHMVAHVLGIRANAVTVEVRRMGGAFGGKETQGNLFAVVAALVAKKTGRAAKIRPDRDDDMIVTGKRHDFLVDYEMGFDDEGRIHAADMTYAARCGWSADLSGPVTDRALFHADNCYFFPDVRLVSQPLRTNTQSNTAFRGFGGPQGMLGAERVIEEIAFATAKDPLEVRKINFYGGPERTLTPYHQTVEDNLAPYIVAELERRSGYWRRRQEILDFNKGSRVIRRGMALTPVKFGISFTATHFNQAGALVHVYTDGSIHLNHGGTEMGQGLYTKVAQVIAEEFQVDIDCVRITATTTGKVPNTSATAASAGSDLNGMAAQAAARTIKQRLAAFAAEAWRVPAEQVVFLAPGRVRIGNAEIAFGELASKAHLARVSLSATGFYKTPKIHWDRATGRGHPFLYFAYGAACSEVAVDTLTGEYRVERVDILHDVGKSLNPAIDLGQIEGGFVQGMGWLTTEELWWDGEGRLRTHAPSTYKIPACGDRPRVFNVEILEGAANREETIYRSKAVGEPPLMLAISVLHAISDAIASVADHRICPRLDAPATPERVLMTIERLRAEAGRRGMTVRLSLLLEAMLARREPAVLVTVAEARGSTPREAGTRMLVTAARIHGTVGGGRLEWEALLHARSLMDGGSASDLLELPLGAALGQCCGGRALLRFERADATALAALAAAEAEERASQPQVLVCGAGHVGTALVRALTPLPVDLAWIDSREDSLLELPADSPPPAREDPVDAVSALRAGAAVVIMTHSHDLDYAIAEAALARSDLAYVGLIGSGTKRRRFEALFTARGRDPRALERLVCPIGDAGVRDKRPEVIAAFTAAEVLQALGRAGVLSSLAAAPRKAAG